MCFVIEFVHTNYIFVKESCQQTFFQVHMIMDDFMADGDFMNYLLVYFGQKRQNSHLVDN